MTWEWRSPVKNRTSIFNDFQDTPNNLWLTRAMTGIRRRTYPSIPSRAVSIWTSVECQGGKSIFENRNLAPQRRNDWVRFEKSALQPKGRQKTGVLRHQRDAAGQPKMLDLSHGCTRMHIYDFQFVFIRG
jgi:hypothetical protein